MENGWLLAIAVGILWAMYVAYRKRQENEQTRKSYEDHKKKMGWD
jgi:predicted histidine transporter YuiF (NhaC family)